ncbi:hypothetical protein TWF696_000840, partial [Orbilia brochopaga]
MCQELRYLQNHGPHAASRPDEQFGRVLHNVGHIVRGGTRAAGSGESSQAGLSSPTAKQGPLIPTPSQYIYRIGG